MDVVTFGETMVLLAASEMGPLRFANTFTGVHNDGLRMRDSRDEFTGDRRNAGEALQQIERDTFASQNASGGTSQFPD